MTYEEIFERINAEPFHPFRIRMASGRAFDVRHPEMIRVGAHSVVVFEYHQRDERIYEKFEILGLQLMESSNRLMLPSLKIKNEPPDDAFANR